VEGPLSVRRAEPSDDGSIARLRWTWRVDERGESGMSQTDFDVALAGWLDAHRRTHLGFVAEDGTALVGMAWLAIVERFPGPGVWARVAGNLQSVYVLPERRGQGVGTALVSAVINEARVRRLDYLVVHPSKRSFSLYERAGFRAHDGVLELDLISSAGGAPPASG
jgi:GNAT superfamily N-acetyltransferase